MADRISSLDNGYQSGDLSVFPDAVDDRTTLYEARNNAKTILKYGLPYNGKKIIVEDASGFPPTGLLRIGPAEGEGNSELVYYGSRTGTVFNDLIRGFAGSIQTSWSSDATYVTNAVVAEHHNAIKDAILKVENFLGTKDAPDTDSLNGIIKQLENRFLVPSAVFRAFPMKGSPPLTVRFQSLCGGHIVRYMWDFGDGTYSIEKNPQHTYTTEGYQTVKLVVVTSTGTQGVTIKNNYIKVSTEEQLTYFYVVLEVPGAPAYSTETAILNGATPAVFSFVDQTDGNILRRIWVFGDGETYEAIDPNEHTAEHTYAVAGEYSPILIVVYADQSIKRVTLPEPLTVL